MYTTHMGNVSEHIARSSGINRLHYSVCKWLVHAPYQLMVFWFLKQILPICSRFKCSASTTVLMGLLYLYYKFKCVCVYIYIF